MVPSSKLLSPQRRQPLAQAAALLLEFLPLLGLLLWLQPFSLIAGRYSVPGNYVDTWQSVWNFWWLQQVQLLHLADIYSTDFIFHPWGCRLELHTLDESLAYPLSALFPSASPQQLLTAAAALLFGANYLSLRLLMRTLGVRPILAVVLAACFCIQPHFLFHLRGGHLNLLTFFPVTVLLNYLVHLVKGSANWRLGVGATAALVFLAYSDFYYSYFLIILFAVLLPALHLSKLLPLPTALKALLPVALAALVFAMPKLLGVLQALHTGDYDLARDATRYPADLYNLFTPYAEQLWSWLTGGSRVYGRYRRGEYLGFALPLMVVFGAYFYRGRLEARDRRLLVCFGLCAVLFLVLTAGQSVVFRGQVLFIDPLYSLLAKLPGFPGVPSRFGIVAQLLLFLSVAVLLEQGLKSPSGYRWAIVGLCLLVIESLPMPPFVSIRAPTPALAQLKADSAVAAVLDADHDPSMPMTRQMYHAKRIVFADIAREPRRALRWAKKNAFVRYLCGKSVSADSQTLRAAWDALKVEALIVNKLDQRQLANAVRVPWLSVVYEDGAVVILK